jgi:hypothetical protein
MHAGNSPHFQFREIPSLIKSSISARLAHPRGPGESMLDFSNTPPAGGQPYPRVPKKLGLKRMQRPRPLREKGGVLRLLCLSKSGCASVNGLLGWLHRDAGSDCVVGVDQCEAISIAPATEIERFTFNTVDVHDLAWFKADPYAS